MQIQSPQTTSKESVQRAVSDSAVQTISVIEAMELIERSENKFSWQTPVALITWVMSAREAHFIVDLGRELHILISA